MGNNCKNGEVTIEFQNNQQGYLVPVTNVNGDVVSYTYDECGNKTSEKEVRSDFGADWR